MHVAEHPLETAEQVVEQLTPEAQIVLHALAVLMLHEELEELLVVAVVVAVV